MASVQIQRSSIEDTHRFSSSWALRLLITNWSRSRSYIDTLSCSTNTSATCVQLRCAKQSSLADRLHPFSVRHAVLPIGLRTRPVRDADSSLRIASTDAAAYILPGIAALRVCHHVLRFHFASSQHIQFPKGIFGMRHPRFSTLQSISI